MLGIGLRIAQLRAIFDLPDYYLKILLDQFKTPLAYIEWFMLFHSHNSNTSMFVVSQSTQMHCSFTEVIPIERFMCSCHLIPDFGNEMDHRWTADNVGLVCDCFFVNPYVDYHSFCLFKLGHRNCI